MEEQLISFNTAILAQEKGFNINTLAYFWKNGELGNNRIGKLGSYDSCYKRALSDYGEKIKCPAPTQSLLQKWLREEHNIDVIGIPVRFTGHLEIAYYTYAVRSIQPMKNYRFTTYEFALEAGLIEGLNLIT